MQQEPTQRVPTQQAQAEERERDSFLSELPEHKSAIGGLKPSRAIGGSINALVRATALYRKGAERFQISDSEGARATQKMVAGRAARAWRNADLSPIDVDATNLSVGGELALQGDNDHAAWILYAFMAGVRKITPKKAMTTNDVIRLVSTLVGLKPTALSIQGFRDWLDADGAEGFEVEVHTSFREVMEEVDLEEQEAFAKAFQVARFELPDSVDHHYLDADEIDRVSMRREFEMPIENYVVTAVGAGVLSETDIEAIGKHSNDPNAWATAELYSVLAVKELRATITPEHMARRVVTRLADEADQRFLMLLTQLNQSDDKFKKAVADNLANEEVGEIIARQLDLEAPGTQAALTQFLALSPDGLAQAVIYGLLGRACDDPLGVEALRAITRNDGPQRLVYWVNPKWLDPDRAGMLGAFINNTAGAPRELTQLMQSVPSKVALSLAAVLNAEHLRHLGSVLHLLLGRTENTDHERVMVLMVKGRDRRNLQLLGNRLLAGKLDRVRGKTLYALCVALVQEGLGEKYVLTAARSRSIKEKTRLIAIDCIGHDRELIKEATRFRFSNFFEPSAVRKRLKALKGSR